MHRFTNEEKEFIRANAFRGTEWVASQINLPYKIVRSFLDRNKIRTGINTKFQSKHKPWNTGLKGVSLGGIETRFKKGSVPYHTKYDGCITVRIDRRGIPLRHIRLSKSKWEYYHRYVWQQTHGQIPAGHIIVFKNGDTLDCRLENLELITLQENARRNHNPVKAGQTMKKLWAEGKITNGQRDLNDQAVARYLAPRDATLQKKLLQVPELLDLKRKSIELKRLIRKQDNDRSPT